MPWPWGIKLFQSCQQSCPKINSCHHLLQSEHWIKPRTWLWMIFRSYRILNWNSDSIFSRRQLDLDRRPAENKFSAIIACFRREGRWCHNTRRGSYWLWAHLCRRGAAGRGSKRGEGPGEGAGGGALWGGRGTWLGPHCPHCLAWLGPWQGAGAGPVSGLGPSSAITRAEGLSQGKGGHEGGVVRGVVAGASIEPQLGVQLPLASPRGRPPAPRPGTGWLCWPSPRVTSHHHSGHRVVLCCCHEPRLSTEPRRTVATPAGRTVTAPLSTLEVRWSRGLAQDTTCTTADSPG